MARNVVNGVLLEREDDPAIDAAKEATRQEKAAFRRSQRYKEERRREYIASPLLSVGDQLDAIYHGFAALSEQKIPLPKKTREWLREIKRIKESVPKP